MECFLTYFLISTLLLGIKSGFFYHIFTFWCLFLNTHPISGINYNILININYKNASCTFFLDVVCCKKGFWGILEYFRGNIPLSKLNSIDKVSETTENGAVSLIKTYYQKWVMIKAVLRMIMITGENKNYPDKSESVPLGYWEFIPGIV